MTVAKFTIPFTVADLGSDDISRVDWLVEVNVANQRVEYPADQFTYVAGSTHKFPGGAGTLTLPTRTGAIPAMFEYKLTPIVYVKGGVRGGEPRAPYYCPAPTSTAAVSLGSLADTSSVPESWMTTATQQLQAAGQSSLAATVAAKDQAVAARAAAEAARAAAESLVITDLGTTDGQTKTLIEAEASETRAALNAAIAAQAPKGSGVARTLTKLRQGQPVKICTIGDSGTFGQGATAGKTYPEQLKVLLEDRFDSIVTVTNVGIGGYTTYSPLNPAVPNGSPTKFSLALAADADLYILSFGHNDSTENFGYPLAASLASYEHMIRRLRIERPGADIMVSNQWQYTGANAGSNNYLAPHTKAHARLAATYGCAHVDFWSALAALGVTGSTPTVDNVYVHSTGNDAQHLTDAGYTVWAESIAEHLPATGPIPAESPALPPRPVFGATWHTHAGWVAMPAAAARTNGAAGYRLTGSWAGAATLPQTSTTANDTIEAHFIGSDVILRLDTGSGQGVVRIDIDGRLHLNNYNLGGLGTRQARIPVTGYGAGVHNVVVTVVSGSVTFRGVEYLPSVAPRIPYNSGLVTYTGTWASATSQPGFFEGGYQSTSTVDDSVTVRWVGTALTLNTRRYAVGHNLEITTDGASRTVSFETTTGPVGQPGVITVESGLPYGLHTTTVKLKSASRTLLVSTFVPLDETRTERPTRLRGRTVTGETVASPVALPSVPTVRLSAVDSAAVLPPYPSSLTASGFTAGGTASAAAEYELETGRVAY